MIPQIGLLTLSGTEPGTGIRPLEAGQRRVYSAIAIVAAAGVALFPFLTWLKSGSVTLAAFDGRSGNPTSGPRLAYILLILGVIVFVAGMMRLRPRGVGRARPEPVAFACALCCGPQRTAFASSDTDFGLHEDGLDPGIGLWLGLVAGLVLVVVALAENKSRGAVGA